MRTEDGYIISQCLDGKPTAFGFLVDKYKRSVYALAYSEVHNFHDAQDITQEVFIKAYRNLNSLKRWDSFMGWLYRITLNVCRDWERSESRRPDHEFIEDQELSVLENPSMEYYRQDSTYEPIREALESLPEIYRQVLVLRYYGGMTVKEMASFLGVSPTTIDRRISEGHSRLKEEILTMMNMTKERYELPSSFTFSIVEMIRNIRIQPISPVKPLPLGLSLAAGLVLLFFGIGSNINLFSPQMIPSGSVMERAMPLTRITDAYFALSDTLNQSLGLTSGGDDKGSGVSEQQNAMLMAPKGEGINIPEKPTAQIGKGKIVQLAFSPDGKILAAASMIGIYLYDAESLNEIGFLKGHTIRLAEIGFTPDSKTLVSLGWDGTARLWDVKERKETGILNAGIEPDNFAISPDGTLLVIGSFDEIQLWDIEQKKIAGTLRGQPGYAYSLAFSPDGQMLASGDSNNKIRLWDLKERKQIGMLDAHQGIVASLIFTPDGKQLISGSWDKTVRVWDVNERKQVNILQGFSPYIALETDGKTLVLCDWNDNNDNLLHFWDIQGWKEIDTLRHTQERGLIRFALSPDGKTIATIAPDSWDPILRILDISEKKEKVSLQGFTAGVRRSCFSPDSNTLAILYYSGIIRLWDTQAQKEVRVLDTIKEFISDIGYSPDGSLLVGVMYSGKVCLWDMKKQEYLGVIFQNDKEYYGVAFNPDAKTIALSREDGVIQLLDIQKREITAELKGHSGRVYHIAFNSDGSELASLGIEAGSDSSLCIWNVKDKKRIAKFQKPGTFAVGYNFEKDLLVLLAYQVDMSLKVWDVQKDIQIASLQVNPPATTWVAEFSPDPNIMASGGARMVPVCLWNISDKNLLAELPDHAEQVNALAFSPDGKWFASGSDDGTVLLWEVDIPVQSKAVNPMGKATGTWGEVKRNDLFQNYPNPFNPETWIPFSLSSSSDVMIRIYSSKGELVRTLDLGQRQPGQYLDRQRAAYWDGRNESGEQVASNIYFTVMEAGEFKSVRKMVMVR